MATAQKTLQPLQYSDIRGEMNVYSLFKFCLLRPVRWKCNRRLESVEATSLGGMYRPRIARSTSDAKGIICR